MRKITREPLSKSEDLGRPLPPESVHAVSVAFPRWCDVVGYEECEGRVISSLQAAYPRFCLHPLVAELFKKCEDEFASDGQFCFAFPSEKVAKECLGYVKKTCGELGKISPYSEFDIYVVTLPEIAKKLVKDFWQHAGQVVSSRLAEAILNGEKPSEGEGVKRKNRQQLASLAGESERDVYLFTSGMSAIYTAYKVLRGRCPDAKTIQLGFPYVDSLKIQEKFGSGVHFINAADDSYISEIKNILENEKIAGVFCEFPTNPLLRSIDVTEVSKLLRKYDVPLVIDDTVATWKNVDLSDYADVSVTSLTKFFSGVGDVLAGSLVLNSKSPFYNGLRSGVEKEYEDLLFYKDAEVLAKNSVAFDERIGKINKTTEELCSFLKAHPKVAEVYYPKYIDKDIYDKYKKPDGGYGGLFSFTFKNEADAVAFYDNVNLDKGPSLGTDFTLICPYTLLAHYNELEFAEKCGVSANLIRVSVGIENADVVLERFKIGLDWLIN